MQARKDVFGRVQEQEDVRVRLQQPRTFLLHGQPGVGKSFLLTTVCPEFPKLIYCQAAGGIQQLCRQLALSLLERGNRAMHGKLGSKPAANLKSITSVSLRGIIADALKQEPYHLVLDHFGFASHQFASMLKQWMAGSTHDKTVVVTNCGRLCLYRKKINLSSSLAGQAVGVKEVDDGIWLVSFMNYDLGYIDLEEKTLQPFENPFGPKV